MNFFVIKIYKNDQGYFFLNQNEITFAEISSNRKKN